MDAQHFDLNSVVEASELLNASLDLDFILGNLLLVAMSRLLVSRGVVLLADQEDGSLLRVVAAKGPAGVELGDTFTFAVPADVAEGGTIPQPLRERGFALLLPIRHLRKAVGLVGLGAKASGDAFEAIDVAFARSLVNISASAIHSARVAGQLQQVNLDLAARVQELKTLFELSQAFGAALDRDEALKLLGFALMGQLLADRHAVLLTQAGGDEPFELAAHRGLKDELDDDFLVHLGTLDVPVRLGGATEGIPEPVLAGLKAHGMAMAMPLRMQDEMRGVLLIGPRATGRAYTGADVAFVASLGTLALTAIENAALVQARIEKERLEEELRLARNIQMRLLPTEMPTIPGYEIASLSLPSRYVAGDYFDVLPLTGGKLLLAIADVSGKGAPAALLMANLQAGLRLLRQELDPEKPDLATATRRLNRVVCENTDAASFITFFWGVLDPESGSFTYVNAGHNPPRLVHPSTGIEPLESGGLILGVLPDAKYEEGNILITPGDALVFYTDGVTEARNADDEEYGETRLDAALLQHCSHSADDCLNALRNDVEAFIDGVPYTDDVTMLVLKAAVG